MVSTCKMGEEKGVGCSLLSKGDHSANVRKGEEAHAPQVEHSRSVDRKRNRIMLVLRRIS